MRQADTTQTVSSDDGPPEDLDRLLRELRREAGSTWSMSMTAPDAKTRTFMMSTRDQAFDDMAALATAQPDDIVLARTVIETATRLGRLTEAKQHLMRLRLAFPDEPDCRAAAAAVAIAEGRYDAAIAILETVLEARPRDQTARVRLLGACQAAGHTQRAAALLDELQSHGFFPKRQNSMPGNLLGPTPE
jgi:predicted Zn-dependent protease